MMEDKNVIDVTKVIKKIWANKKVFYITLPIVAVLSALLIICVPRTYSTETKMAPEIENNGLGGTIGDIASSFGVDLGTMQTSDAISPLLYPDLMEDNGFVTELFPVKVSVVDDDRNFTTTYYEYLDKHQKKAWWTPIINSFKNIFKSKEKGGGGKKEADPYYLSKREDDIAESMRSKISISVDKQTAVITISVKDQNAVICKCIADTVREKLQEYITRYRTKKAIVDMQHYQSLEEEAKANYDKAVQDYASLVDSNFDVFMQSERSKQEKLENDMQLKYNTYTTLHAQYEAAKAKVQERTPAFTMIKGAAVPIKPSAPKRMLFVLGMMILAGFCDILYIMRKDIKGYLLK